MNLEAFIIGAIIGWGLYIILRGMASASHERHIAARQSAARRWAAVCQDGKLAERAREQIHAVSDAWHIYSEGRATRLFVHPSDEVILPYIVATNRGMDGPLRFCGMTVLYDSFLPIGDWRIE